MGRGHPECPQRLDAINDHLLATGLDVALERREAPMVDLSELALAHSAGYVAELKDLARAGGQTAASRARSIPTPSPAPARWPQRCAPPARRWPPPTR